MKKKISKFGAWVILLVMFVMLIPGITLRITKENKNNNVTMSVLYNNFENKMNEKELNKILDEFYKNGINTISVMEEDINYLVSKGKVTSIKYNVLGHKYDTESIEIYEMIKKVYPDVNYDSYVVILDEDDVKEKFDRLLPKRFSEKDYIKIGTYNHLDIYLFHDGKKALWDFAIGYDENVIKELKERGFEIALVHKVKNYSNTLYLKDIERIVKEYDVKFMNLKEDSFTYPEKEQNKDNYKIMADIITGNNTTLVVTENTDQLSNQKFFGYDYIYNEAVSKTDKVLRSYETYDSSQEDLTKYKYRVEQFLNSTVDRNIRFITVTLLDPRGKSYWECAELSLNAAKEYKAKAEANGFVINKGVEEVVYTANKKLNSAVCAVIIIMCMYLALGMIFGTFNMIFFLGALILSALAFIGTYVIPDALVSLYPTAYSVVQPCFAITAVLCFVKKMAKKLPSVLLAVSSVAIMLIILLIGAVGMGAMLSGTNYYINNDIFRGIKLSLLVPTLYTAVIYYFMFIKKKENSILNDVKKVLVAEIKVYWLIIAGVVGAVGVYYIVRSGNVNSISGIEHAMRTTLTEIFPARPRTKEFLIGYPALVIFTYYFRNVNCDLIKWILAVGASILATSVTNSFCHVFTGFSVIATRTMNGLIVGFFVTVIVYIANIVMLKIINQVAGKIKNTEMK